MLMVAISHQPARNVDIYIIFTVSFPLTEIPICVVILFFSHTYRQCAALCSIDLRRCTTRSHHLEYDTVCLFPTCAKFKYGRFECPYTMWRCMCVCVTLSVACHVYVLLNRTPRKIENIFIELRRQKEENLGSASKNQVY